MEYIVFAGSFGITFLLAYFIRPRMKTAVDSKEQERLQKEKEVLARKIIEEAKKEVEKIKENLIQEKEEWGKRIEHTRQLAAKKEEVLSHRLAWKGDVEKVAQTLERDIRQIQGEQRSMKQREQEELLKRTKLSKEMVVKKLLDDEYRRITDRAETRLRSHEEILREDSMHKAKDLLTSAISRYGDTALVEEKSPDIPVPQDIMKGRFIGAEGRNIRMFEELTGVDVIFDDSPDTITLSSFDLVKREVAKRAIQKLLREQLISPEKIQAHIKKAEKEAEDEVLVVGKKVLKFIGVAGKPDKFAYIVGRLKFRTSYGQNVLKHSIEIAYISRMLADELGVNARVAFLAGFFHDIGKALDQERNQPHDVVTRDILREYGFPEDIVHAAWTHHETEPPKTVEAKIVRAADAISASRPGARQESLEQYIQRIRELEAIAAAHKGVKKSYAMSAGREIRIFVEPEEISDEALPALARSVADCIQTQLSFPGKIKVNAIRRTEIVVQAT